MNYSTLFEGTLHDPNIHYAILNHFNPTNIILLIIHCTDCTAVRIPNCNVTQLQSELLSGTNWESSSCLQHH